MKEIEMIATFIPDKLPIPERFRATTEDMDLLVVNIDKVLFFEEEKREKRVKYRCVCVINNRKQTYDIYFYKESMRWFLDKK